MEINKDIADLQAAEEIRSKRKKFILCYHNFNAKNFKKASAQIRKLAEAAGSPISIAVVPSIGGVPESEAEEFQATIQQFVDEGYEIMIHGARHRADLAISRDWVGKAALWISGNEAEFAGLDEKFTIALLKRSLALWKANCSHAVPSGFVPPIWFGNRHLREQALEQFDHYEDLSYIYSKRNGAVKKIPSKTLSFSILPDILLGVAQTRACLTMMLPGGIPRLVFHQKDFVTIGEKRIMNLIRYVSTMREKVMYKDL